MPGKRGRPRGTIKAESERIYSELTKLQEEHAPDTISRLRKSIQGQVIIQRLMQHVRGEIELLPTQIQAAALLLNRILPTLTAVQVDVVEDDRPAVVRAPAPIIDAPSWQRLIEHETSQKNGNGQLEPNS